MRNTILYEKEITVNAIDSAYEKGKKEGTIEELEKTKKEIHDMSKIYHEGQNGWFLRMSEVIDLLDKHISELKQ